MEFWVVDLIWFVKIPVNCMDFFFFETIRNLKILDNKSFLESFNNLPEHMLYPMLSLDVKTNMMFYIEEAFRQAKVDLIVKRLILSKIDPAQDTFLVSIVRSIAESRMDVIEYGLPAESKYSNVAYPESSVTTWRQMVLDRFDFDVLSKKRLGNKQNALELGVVSNFAQFQEGLKASVSDVVLPNFFIDKLDLTMCVGENYNLKHYLYANVLNDLYEIKFDYYSYLVDTDYLKEYMWYLSKANREVMDVNKYADFFSYVGNGTKKRKAIHNSYTHRLYPLKVSLINYFGYMDLQLPVVALNFVLLKNNYFLIVFYNCLMLIFFFKVVWHQNFIKFLKGYLLKKFWVERLVGKSKRNLMEKGAGAYEDFMYDFGFNSYFHLHSLQAMEKGVYTSGMKYQFGFNFKKYWDERKLNWEFVRLVYTEPISFFGYKPSHYLVNNDLKVLWMGDNVYLPNGGPIDIWRNKSYAYREAFSEDLYQHRIVDNWEFLSNWVQILTQFWLVDMSRYPGEKGMSYKHRLKVFYSIVDFFRSLKEDQTIELTKYNVDVLVYFVEKKVLFPEYGAIYLDESDPDNPKLKFILYSLADIDLFLYKVDFYLEQYIDKVHYWIFDYVKEDPYFFYHIPLEHPWHRLKPIKRSMFYWAQTDFDYDSFFKGMMNLGELDLDNVFMNKQFTQFLLRKNYWDYLTFPNRGLYHRDDVSYITTGHWNYEYTQLLNMNSFNVFVDRRDVKKVHIYLKDSVWDRFIFDFYKDQQVTNIHYNYTKFKENIHFLKNFLESNFLMNFDFRVVLNFFKMNYGSQVRLIVFFLNFLNLKVVGNYYVNLKRFLNFVIFCIFLISLCYISSFAFFLNNSVLIADYTLTLPFLNSIESLTELVKREGLTFDIDNVTFIEQLVEMGKLDASKRGLKSDNFVLKENAVIWKPSEVGFEYPYPEEYRDVETIFTGVSEFDLNRYKHQPNSIGKEKFSRRWSKFFGWLGAYNMVIGEPVSFIENRLQSRTLLEQYFLQDWLNLNYVVRDTIYENGKFTKPLAKDYIKLVAQWRERSYKGVYEKFKKEIAVGFGLPASRLLERSAIKLSPWYGLKINKPVHYVHDWRDQWGVLNNPIKRWKVADSRENYLWKRKVYRYLRWFMDDRRYGIAPWLTSRSEEDLQFERTHLLNGSMSVYESDDALDIKKKFIGEWYYSTNHGCVKYTLNPRDVIKYTNDSLPFKILRKIYAPWRDLVLVEGSESLTKKLKRLYFIKKEVDKRITDDAAGTAKHIFTVYRADWLNEELTTLKKKKLAAIQYEQEIKAYVDYLESLSKEKGEEVEEQDRSEIFRTLYADFLNDLKRQDYLNLFVNKFTDIFSLKQLRSAFLRYPGELEWVPNGLKLERNWNLEGNKDALLNENRVDQGTHLGLISGRNWFGTVWKKRNVKWNIAYENLFEKLAFTQAYLNRTLHKADDMTYYQEWYNQLELLPSKSNILDEVDKMAELLWRPVKHKDFYDTLEALIKSKKERVEFIKTLVDMFSSSTFEKTYVNKAFTKAHADVFGENELDIVLFDRFKFKIGKLNFYLNEIERKFERRLTFFFYRYRLRDYFEVTSNYGYSNITSELNMDFKYHYLIKGIEDTLVKKNSFLNYFIFFKDFFNFDINNNKINYVDIYKLRKEYNEGFKTQWLDRMTHGQGYYVGKSKYFFGLFATMPLKDLYRDVNVQFFGRSLLLDYIHHGGIAELVNNKWSADLVNVQGFTKEEYPSTFSFLNYDRDYLSFDHKQWKTEFDNSFSDNGVYFNNSVLNLNFNNLVKSYYLFKIFNYQSIWGLEFMPEDMVQNYYFYTSVNEFMDGSNYARYKPDFDFYPFSSRDDFFLRKSIWKKWGSDRRDNTIRSERLLDWSYDKLYDKPMDFVHYFLGDNFERVWGAEEPYRKYLKRWFIKKFVWMTWTFKQRFFLYYKEPYDVYNGGYYNFKFYFFEKENWGSFVFLEVFFNILKNIFVDFVSLLQVEVAYEKNVSSLGWGLWDKNQVERFLDYRPSRFYVFILFYVYMFYLLFVWMVFYYAMKYFVLLIISCTGCLNYVFRSLVLNLGDKAAEKVGVIMRRYYTRKSNMESIFDMPVLGFLSLLNNAVFKQENKLKDKNKLFNKLLLTKAVRHSDLWHKKDYYEGNGLWDITNFTIFLDRYFATDYLDDVKYAKLARQGLSPDEISDILTKELMEEQVKIDRKEKVDLLVRVFDALKDLSDAIEVEGLDKGNKMRYYRLRRIIINLNEYLILTDSYMREHVAQLENETILAYIYRLNQMRLHSIKLDDIEEEKKKKEERRTKYQPLDEGNMVHTEFASKGYQLQYRNTDTEQNFLYLTEQKIIGGFEIEFLETIMEQMERNILMELTQDEVNNPWIHGYPSEFDRIYDEFQINLAFILGNRESRNKFKLLRIIRSIIAGGGRSSFIELADYMEENWYGNFYQKREFDIGFLHDNSAKYILNQNFYDESFTNYLAFANLRNESRKGEFGYDKNTYRSEVALFERDLNIVVFLLILTLSIYLFFVMNVEFSYFKEFDQDSRFTHHIKKTTIKKGLFKKRVKLNHYYGKHWEEIWTYSSLWHDLFDATYNMNYRSYRGYTYMVNNEDLVNIYDIMKYNWQRETQVLNYIYTDFTMYKTILVKKYIYIWNSYLDKNNLYHIVRHLGYGSADYKDRDQIRSNSMSTLIENYLNWNDCERSDKARAKLKFHWEKDSNEYKKPKYLSYRLVNKCDYWWYTRKRFIYKPKEPLILLNGGNSAFDVMNTSLFFDDLRSYNVTSIGKGRDTAKYFFGFNQIDFVRGETNLIKHEALTYGQILFKNDHLGLGVDYEGVDYSKKVRILGFTIPSLSNISYHFTRLFTISMVFLLLIMLNLLIRQVVNFLKDKFKDWLGYKV